MRGVSRHQDSATIARNFRKSPAYPGNIPVFRRLCPETFFDLHCKAGLAGDLLISASEFWAYLTDQTTG
jgi:hypothetical protein